MTRRRRPLRVLGAALLYFGFAFVSPVALVSAPFALLLLWQGQGLAPRLYAVVPLLLVLLSVTAGGDEFAHFEAAWVLVLAGASVVTLVLRPPARHDLVGSALITVGMAALAGALLVSVTHFSWDQLRWAAEHHFGRQVTRVMSLVFAGAGQGVDAEVLDGLRASAAATVRAISLLLPALVLLQSLAALAAAWALYGMFAGDDTTPPVPALRAFRFNDHLVWGIVLALLALVTPGLGSLRVVGGNLAAFFGGLYVARGMGVVVAIAALSGVTGAFAVVLGLVVTLFLAPLVLFTTLAIGVSDTWVDWRRVAAARKNPSK